MNIVVAILLLFQLQAASGQAGVIAGQLRTVNGMPAADVRVAATPVNAEATPDGSRTLVSISQTDADGRYRLENIPPGNYHVLAGLLDRPTYYPAATQIAAAAVVRVTAGITTQEVDFALVRSAGVIVKGRVVRADGNTGTRQWLYMNSSTGGGAYMPLNVEAALDGSFAFSRVPPGNYTITLSPGFPGGQPLPITVGETDIAGIEFFVPLVRAVSGGIVVSDGSPLPRLSISFTSSDATINSTAGTGGAFELSLPEGDYRIGLSGFPFGYTVESVTHGGTDLSRAVLRVGPADVSGVLISFKAPPAEAWLRVRGQVERPAGGGPTPNKVVLRGSRTLQDMETPIEADGSFEFHKVLPGTYNAQVEPVAGIPTMVTLNVNRDIDGLKIAIPRQIEVRGRIMVEDGAPVPSVVVTATGKRGVIHASPATGGFRFILPEGEHRIELPALPTGYALKSITHGSTDLQRTPLRLSGADSPEVLVTLGLASPSIWRRVSGKVSAPADSAALNTMRVALSGSGLNVEAAVKDDGGFEFSKLLPGSYTVHLLPGNGLSPTTITVADKDVAGIELRIPNRVPVTGRVTMEDGVPLPRASILVDNETRIDIGMLRPDGSFTIRLPEGEHRLSMLPHSNAYRVKSMTLGPVNLLQRQAAVSAADTQQLLVEFQMASPSLWKKASGRLRQSPDAALPSNRVLLGGTVIQNFEAALNADGSFEFPKVPSGTFAVYLQPPGLYSPSAEFAVTDSDVTGVELAAPEIFKVSALVSLENGGAFSSKDIVIRAQTARPVRGVMGMAESVTDEEDLAVALVAGEYRIMTVRLPAGFVVRSMTHGATDLLTAPLKVDRPTNTRIEITLRSVDPASITGARIGGRVRMPPDEGTPRPATVALSATQSGGQTFETPIIDGGTFQFRSVPPGTYDARLIGPNIPAAIQQYRKQVVVTGKDEEGIELTAVVWSHVRGRVVLDGPGSLPNFRDRNIGLQFRQGGFAIGDAVHPDGSFEMALVRGDYQVALDLPEPYYIKSISSRGADLLQGRFTHDANGPREIVITLGTRAAPR